MAYLNEEQLKDGSVANNTIAPGDTANVVLTEYAPFQSKKGTTIPKHKGKDADTGVEYEFVGFKFHDAVKQLNDAIVPGVTVVRVECLDNGTIYSDYELSVVVGAVAKEVAKDEIPF